MHNKRKSNKQNIYISTKFLNYEAFSVQYEILNYREILDYGEIQQEFTNEFLLRIYGSKIKSISSLSNSEPTYEDKKQIATKIYLSSLFLNEDMNILVDSLDIALSPEISTPTFDCNKCQEKGLNKFRNCAFLGEETKDPTFSILLGKKYFKSCPVALIDKGIVADAFTAYNIFKARFLPSNGGWYEQTAFFCIASQYVNNAIETAKMENLKKQSN